MTVVKQSERIKSNQEKIAFSAFCFSFSVFQPSRLCLLFLSVSTNVLLSALSDKVPAVQDGYLACERQHSSCPRASNGHCLHSSLVRVHCNEIIEQQLRRSRKVVKEQPALMLQYDKIKACCTLMLRVLFPDLT